MDPDEPDAAIDSVVAVLTDVIEDAHELVVAAWPTTVSGAHERIDLLIAAGGEFEALSQALRVIQLRSERAGAQRTMTE